MFRQLLIITTVITIHLGTLELSAADLTYQDTLIENCKALDQTKHGNFEKRFVKNGLLIYIHIYCIHNLSTGCHTL